MNLTSLRKRFSTIAFVIILPCVSYSQNDSILPDCNLYHRDYTVIYGLENDVLNSAENFRTGLKLFSDAYFRGLAPNIKNKTVGNIAGFTCSFLAKWSSILWPHEFGHVLRTNQAGGNFSFVKLQFPGVVGKLVLPTDATPEHHTLALIGGFEANYLTARDIQSDFFKYNGLYNDELGMAFGHRIMYPLYAYVFARQNPKDAQTWILSGGDPVNFTKLVWEMGNKEVFNEDGSVDNDLVTFYNKAALISVVWNLLDLNTYKQAGAFFGNELNGKRPLYFGNNTFNWSYGTFFNASVLGAELYFNNYLKLNNRFYTIYFKYGFPFKNNGLGITLSDLVKYRIFSIDAQVDRWSQDYYGNGFSLSTTGHYRIKEKLNVVAQVGYKTEGYLVGRSTKKGFIGFIGLKYDMFR
jgi:hypothetical protein